MQALTTKVLNSAGSGTVYSTDAGQYGTVSPHANFRNGILYAQLIDDKSGIVQVAANSGLTGTVTIQGRMDADAAWYDIVDITETDWDADPQYSAVKVITMFPQMRVKSVMSAGTPDVSVWITE